MTGDIHSGYTIVTEYSSIICSWPEGLMSEHPVAPQEKIPPAVVCDEDIFLEFRRKVRDCELLSASLERLLLAAHFTGRLSVVVQNGRVLKSGYEEGYFSRKKEARLLF